jgi:glutamine amidotransferase
MGNLRSVEKALVEMGMSVKISGDAEVVKRAEKIILPGVGNFSAAVSKIKSKGLWDVIDEKVQIYRTPILGICLGMQLLAKTSEEGNESGFGWIDATVKRFSVSDTLKYKIPHVGWNSARSNSSSPLLKGIVDSDLFYFVHAYHMVCAHKEDSAARTIYDYEFDSIVSKNHIFGVQFHPEKSYEVGKKIFKNFMEF